LDRTAFAANRDAFEALLRRLIVELGLQGQIEVLRICWPREGRTVLYREDPWPSKRLNLEMYTDPEKYMDEQLLRHELGHEADRQDPEMLYDPAIEERWKHCWALSGAGKRWKPLDLAANISLDARLGGRGLGKKKRLEEFRKIVGKEHGWLFEEAWANPPRTWPEIEGLAKRLLASLAVVR
jgi:hypothetical protein